MIAWVQTVGFQDEDAIMKPNAIQTRTEMPA